jgi:hypothetical protein
VEVADPHLLVAEVQVPERRRAHALLDPRQVVEVLVEQVAALALARERVAVLGAEEELLGARDLLRGRRTRLQKSKNILFGSSGCGRCVNTQTKSEWMLKVAFGNSV